MKSNLSRSGTSGRILRQDGEETRGRLLDAAEALFAERGFHATAIREVVRSARCNIAAVNYHFHGKEGLYIGVMRRRLVELRRSLLQRIRASVEERDSPPALEDVLRAYAVAFVAPSEGHSRARHLFQLFSRELLDSHLEREVLLSELIEPVQEGLREAVLAAEPSIDDESLRRGIQLFVGQLVHLLHLNGYFTPDQCRRLGFSLFQETLDAIVCFTAGGMRALRQDPTAASGRERERTPVSREVE